MLGPADYGRYSFITKFIGFFMIVAYFGLRWVVVREISADRTLARAYLRIGLRIRTITTLTAIVACCTIGFLLHLDHSVKLGIAIFSVSLAVGGIGELLEGVLLALGRSYCIAGANVTASLLKFVVGTWALYAGHGLFGVLAVFVAATMVSTGLDILFVKSALRGEDQRAEEPGLTKLVLRESLPFVVQAGAARLYQKNDIIFLTMLRGNEATGIYSAAYVFLDLLMAVASSVVAAVYPMVAKMQTESAHSVSEAYGRLHKYMLLGLLPISAALMFLGPSILVTVFGKAYVRGNLPLQILVWTLPVEVSCLVSGTFLCAMYQQRLTAIITICTASLNVVATVGLIMLYSATGAAVATVGGSLVSAVIHYVYVRRVVGPISTLDAWLKPLACGGLMLSAMCCIPISMTIIRVIAGILVYVAALAAVRPIDAEDRRLMLSLLKRNANKVAAR